MSTLESFFFLKNNPARGIFTGELVHGVLEIWPQQEVNIGKLSTIKNHFLNADLYLVRPLSIRISENNPDLLIYEGVFVFVRPFNLHKDDLWDLGDQQVKVKYKKTFIIEKTKESDQILIIGQTTKVGGENAIYLALVLGILVIAVYLIRRQKKQGRLKLEKSLTPEVISKLKSAEKREDFEKIYQLQSQWLPALKDKNSGEIEKFFCALESKQYQKYWSDEDLALVRQHFNKCKELL